MIDPRDFSYSRDLTWRETPNHHGFGRTSLASHSGWSGGKARGVNEVKRKIPKAFSKPFSVVR